MADQDANVVLTADVSGYQQGMSQAESSTNSALAGVLALNNAIGQLTQRAGRKLEIVGAATLTGLTAAAVSAGRLEQQMSQLQASSMITGRSFGTVAAQVNGLRRDFAVTTDQAVQLTTQLRNMGQSQSGLGRLAETFVRLGAVTGESISGLASGLISLQRTMGTEGVNQTNRFAASLANVSARAGVSAQGVLSFANAIAPIGRVAGMTQNEITGVSTAFVKSGQDGFAAANAFNKMLTDITRSVQYGSPDLKAYSNLIGVSVDQFKSMPRTEAVTRIFEEINKQGPDAIKTLERFGLDGIRTYRALQSVASTGGIRKAISDANAGYGDQGQQRFMDASQKALDGFNDQLQKLGNNTTMVAQAFGAGLLPVFTKATAALNGVLSPLNQVLEGLGKLPGIATAGAAATTLLAGGLLTQFTRLTALGLGAAVIRGPAGAGFTAGRMVGQGAMGPATAAQAAYAAGQGGMFQRALFGAGQAAGGLAGRLQGATGAPGTGFLNRMSQTAGWGVQQAGAFMRYGLEPLYPANMRNPFNRQPLFTASTPREFFAQQGQRMGSAASNIGNLFSTNAQTRAAAQAAAGINSLGAASTRNVGLFRALGLETGRLTIALAKAAAGATMGIGGGVARAGAGAIGRLGSSALGFLGGPWGLAMMGGMGLLAARSKNQSEQGRILSDDESYAAGSKYAEALGQASVATTKFADVVQSATQRANQASRAGATVAGAIQVSGTDVSTAMSPTGKYTDRRVATMTRQDAVTFAASTLSNPSVTPEQAGLLKMDMVRRFGAQGGQAILNEATSGRVSSTDLFRNIGRGQTQRFGITNDLFTQSGTTERSLAAGDTMRSALAGQANNPRNASRLTLTAFNQAAAAYGSRANQNNPKGREAIVRAYARGLGIDEKDTASIEALQSAFSRSIGGFNNLAQIQVASGGTGAGQMIDFARRNVGSNWNYQSSQFNPTPVTQQQPDRFASISPFIQASLRQQGGMSSYILGENALSRRVTTAVTNQGDANAQVRAANEMAQTFTRMSGSFAGATDELQRMKAAIGDTNEPLYQLAQAAEANVRQRQQEAMGYMTRGQQAQQLARNYQVSRTNAQQNPSPEAEQTAEQDRQVLERSRQNAYEFFRGIVQQQRELNVARARGEEDMARQQGRALEDFNLQRERAESDFQRSRARQESDFQRSRSRAESDFSRQMGRAREDYNRSRGRELEDFNRSRSRGEEDFTRQLRRQVRDYNISRTQAQADFDLSRRRSEEDFQHQVQLMTQETARTIYNTYERITVQQTWSAQNLIQNMQDQQRRMDDQVRNLQAVRAAGVSGDVIKQLGLNESQNAQQLARFAADVANDPRLVAEFNRAASNRRKTAGKIVTDEDNTQWEEMQRSFNLNAERAQSDFDRSMRRQAESFARGLSDMRKDYNTSITRAEDDFERARDRQSKDFARQIERQIEDFNRQMERQAEDFNRQIERAEKDFNRQLTRQEEDFDKSLDRMQDDFGLAMERAAEDMSRMAEEITGSFGDIAEAAISSLTGVAKKQAKVLEGAYKDVRTNTGTLVDDVNKTLEKLGLSKTTSSSSANAAEHRAEGKRVDFRNNNISQSKIGTGGGSDTDASVVMPLTKYTPTSGFGPRSSPGGIGSTNHKGQDMAAPFGTPIRAAKGGTVIWAGRSGGYGNLVKIDTGNGVENLYGHMSSVGTRVGKAVNAGDFIGRVGSTGHSTGNHLHFEVRVDGRAVPPMPFLRGAKVAGTNMNMPSDISNADVAEALDKLSSMRQWEKIVARVPALASRIPPGFLSQQIAKNAVQRARESAENGDSGDLSALGSFSGGGNAAANRALGKRMAAAIGWTGGQWQALDWVVQHESGWRNTAQNPTSTAFGLFQFLNGTWRGYGSKTSDPAKQLEYGMRYIRERYHDPMGAKAFWQSHHWYGDGAIINGGPQTIGVGERGPEAVLPLNQKGVDFLMALMKQYIGHDAQNAHLNKNSVNTESKTVTYSTHVDRSTHYDGSITVQADDPMEFKRKMEADARLKALTNSRR